MRQQGKELSAINFEHIIGGPLVAVIKAQAQAAQTTTNFIQTFAFDGTGGSQKLKAIAFDFSQVINFPSEAGALASDLTTIKVPLLTLIPIPHIRVDSMTIEFNVNLHSSNSETFSNDFTFSSSGSGSYEFVSFSASVSDHNTYQQSSIVDDTYSMKVTVHAVQDQMPGGMAQVLNIFSNVVQSQAGLIQTIVAAEAKALTDKAQKALAPGG